jgi:hypothetical protein
MEFTPEFIAAAKKAAKETADSFTLLNAPKADPLALFPSENEVSEEEEKVLAIIKEIEQVPSAYDRINHRRLINSITEFVRHALIESLFEYPEDIPPFVTRMIGLYLDHLQEKESIESYSVVCDTRNNTDGVYDTTELVVDVYITPTKAMEYIQLNFVLTEKGVGFDEVTGSFDSESDGSEYDNGLDWPNDFCPEYE